MKRSELIAKYEETISSAMIERYRRVLDCGGRIQCKLYITENGELMCMEGAQGDNFGLRSPALHFVCAVACPNFNPWDYADRPAPEDEDLREQEREEIIESIMDDYRANITSVLDALIEDAEREERYS